jgi:anthranilate phosphoribosyltransferase
MVVHGSDALDEFTVTGKTVVAELRDGMVKKYQFDPSELGLKKRKLEELKGGQTSEENALIILSILKGEELEAKRDIALLNAAAAIYVSDSNLDFNQAFEKAVESLESGKALAKLNEFVEFTKQ